MYYNILFLVIFILIFLIILNMDYNKKNKFQNVNNEETKETEETEETEEMEETEETEETEEAIVESFDDSKGINHYKKFLKSFGDGTYIPVPNIEYKDNCLLCLNKDGTSMCRENKMNLNLYNDMIDKRKDVPSTLSWDNVGIGRKFLRTDEVIFNDKEYSPNSSPVFIGSTYKSPARVCKSSITQNEKDYEDINVFLEYDEIKQLYLPNKPDTKQKNICEMLYTPSINNTIEIFSLDNKEGFDFKENEDEGCNDIGTSEGSTISIKKYCNKIMRPSEN